MARKPDEPVGECPVCHCTKVVIEGGVRRIAHEGGRDKIVVDNGGVIAKHWTRAAQWPNPVCSGTGKPAFVAGAKPVGSQSGQERKAA